MKGKRQEQYVKSNAAGSLDLEASLRKYYDECQKVFGAFKDEDFYGPKAQHIFFYGDVEGEDVQELRKALQDASENKASLTKGGGKIKHRKQSAKPVVLHIHSRGGLAVYGLTMANFISQVQVPLAVVVDGYACSAATCILVAAPYRVMHDASYLLIHEISTEVRWGRQTNANFSVHRTHNIADQYKALYKSNTVLSDKDLNDLLSRDKMFGAKDCMKAGIVDRVIEMRRQDNQVKGDVTFGELRNMAQIYAYDGKLVNKTFNGDIDIDAKRREMLKLVKQIQDAALGKAPKPIVLHGSMNFAYDWSVFDIGSLMIRVHTMPAPVYSIIDSSVDLVQALPCIMAQKRFMYANMTMTVRLHFELKGLFKYDYYDDIVHNTGLVRTTIIDILRKHAKFPKHMLDNMFNERLLLSAEDCLKYGLIDEIIPVPSRSVGLDSKRIVQGGGCTCSQGLAYNF